MWNGPRTPPSPARVTRSPLVPLQAAVPAALQALLGLAPLSAGKVSFAWRATVGSTVDRATHVRLASDGRLEVEATDARWAREVRRSIPVILPRLATLLGAGVVRTLDIRTARRNG
jgi:predicted nucleic acid-binding Zn ribbon protein